MGVTADAIKCNQITGERIYIMMCAGLSGTGTGPPQVEVTDVAAAAVAVGPFAYFLRPY